MGVVTLESMQAKTDRLARRLMYVPAVFDASEAEERRRLLKLHAVSRSKGYCPQVETAYHLYTFNLSSTGVTALHAHLSKYAVPDDMAVEPPSGFKGWAHRSVKMLLHDDALTFAAGKIAALNALREAIDLIESGEVSVSAVSNVKDTSGLLLQTLTLQLNHAMAFVKSDSEEPQKNHISDF
jgi:hypothetical protein